MSDLQSKPTALITGATSGIGAAFARRFAKDGYNLILHGRREEKLQTLANELKKAHGISTEVIIAELSDTKDIEKIEKRIRGLDRLDALVNNAGYWTPGAFWETEPDEIKALIKVHNIAPARFIRAALPEMMKRNKGDIINIASIGAHFPTIALENYSASKNYLITLSESLHVGLLETGLRIMALVPGLVLTDFHSRLGADVSKARMKAMMPDELVEKCLNALEKGKVVYIPTFRNRLKVWFVKSMPRRSAYKILHKHGKASKERWEEIVENSKNKRQG